MARRGTTPKPRTYPTAAAGPAPAPGAPVRRANAIVVRGARTHNLKNLDVEIPHDTFVVITGVSGSGKSSLAFDTIHAEGRRRFLETLSPASRKAVGRVAGPDVNAISGLPPTIAIDQHSASPSPRRTVSLITEIDDHLRALYAAIGVPHCTRCGREVRAATPERIVESVLARGEGKRVILLAPIARDKKGENREAIRAIKAAGLLRARIDGAIVELDPEPALAKAKTHAIDAVVDRLVIRDGMRARVSQSLSLALGLGEGTVIVSTENPVAGVWDDETQSVHHACPHCGVGFARLDAASLSFNHPRGACPLCKGLGFETTFDADLAVPDRSRSLNRGAIAPWRVLEAAALERMFKTSGIEAFLIRESVDRSAPIERWPSAAVGRFLEGDGDFEGLFAILARQAKESRSERLVVEIESARVERECPDCRGGRLSHEARLVAIEGVTLPQLNTLDLAAANAKLGSWRFAEDRRAIAEPLLEAIAQRIAFLNRAGLSYLSLGRRTDTLSGGELQRVRLAGQIGSGVNGACYVLDEPTAGLHPCDTKTLIACLLELRDRGNSLIVVEHDEETIRSAERLIDLGPGAGAKGGELIACGTLEDLAANPRSITGAMLGAPQPLRGGPSALKPDLGVIAIRGACWNNLKGVDVDIPIGCLVGFTGVSGSGKSSLVLDVLGRSARRRIDSGGLCAIGCASVSGLEGFERLVIADQKPMIGRARSTAATYSGALDAIRQVFAKTKEARRRGFGPARFSFNNKAGACPRCRGQGVLKSPLSFLPELETPCPACLGRRFNEQTLSVTFKSKTVAETLEMSVAQAHEFFSVVPKVAQALEPLEAAGLGYLALGQASAELSGGEAQRLKLALALGPAGAGGKTLILLDEPTAGLHIADVAHQIAMLRARVDQGDTVVVIEHNLEVIAAADWVIDLGPRAGAEGGRVVFAGTPHELAASASGPTAQALRERFTRGAGG